MAILLIVALYGLAFSLLFILSLIQVSNEIRFGINVVFGVVALVLPICAYAIIDRKLTEKAIIKVGEEWCYKNSKIYEGTEMHKNHFTLVYSSEGKKERKKFRVQFIATTWRPKKVLWI